MSGPTREDFEKAIEKHWHGRPPASLEDVMALYGILAVAESGGSLYGTPSMLDPFADDGRLVVIDVDLTGDKPIYTDVDGGIRVTALRTEDIPQLAYSHKSSGRGAKYSLTQIGSKNGNDATGVANTILGRIRSWTTQDSVQSITGDDGHPDAWVVKDLATVFEKEGETFKKIETDIESVLPSDQSVPTVLTVRCLIDGGDIHSSETNETQWFWPADLDVLQQAMQRYATANATDKNIDSGSSEGEAVGVVSGQMGRVVGTPESPLEVFSVKHPDAQPGLRRDQSWRNYPVSDDVAMLFSKGQDLIERCVLRRGGIETYTLPYFAGELNWLKAQTIYDAIQSLGPERDEFNAPMSLVTYEIDEHEDEAIRELGRSELRFYMLSLPISDDKNVIAEEPAAGTYWVTTLAKELIKTVRGPTLSPRQGGFSSYDNWDLLDFGDLSDTDIARKRAFDKIVGHVFTDAAFAYRDEEGDDFRRIVDHRIIAGVPIEASVLFDEYMRRFGDEFDGDEPVPHQVIAQQLVHLESLSRAGLLTGLDVPVEPTDTQIMIPIEDADIDLSDLAAIREYRLESFLDRPLFTENTERKAAALAGVLVGQVSWHQEAKRDLGRPLDSKIRGDQLTKNGLEHGVLTALEKAKVYAKDSDYDRDILFPETVDILLETTERLPTEWDEIDKRELQFSYVLGHAHGRRSMPNAFDLQEKNDSEKEDETVESPAN